MVIEMVGYNMGSIEVIIEFNQVGDYKTMCQFDSICIFDPCFELARSPKESRNFGNVHPLRPYWVLRCQRHSGSDSVSWRHVGSKGSANTQHSTTSCDQMSIVFVVPCTSKSVFWRSETPTCIYNHCPAHMLCIDFPYKLQIYHTYLYALITWTVFPRCNLYTSEVFLSTKSFKLRDDFWKVESG